MWTNEIVGISKNTRNMLIRWRRDKPFWWKIWRVKRLTNGNKNITYRFCWQKVSMVWKLKEWKLRWRNFGGGGTAEIFSRLTLVGFCIWPGRRCCCKCYSKRAFLLYSAILNISAIFEALRVETGGRYLADLRFVARFWCCRTRIFFPFWRWSDMRMNRNSVKTA